MQLKSYKEVPKPSNVTPCMDTTFPKTSPVHLKEKHAYCNTIYPITQYDAVQLEQKTTLQSKCPLWFEERKKRLTASIFSKVCKRKKDINTKFLGALFHPKSFSSDATSYGKVHEVDGKKAYCIKMPDVHIHDCGLVVNPRFSFLGASPDGKVCDGQDCGVLEIKCPYTARNLTVQEAIDTIPNFCLKEEDGFILNNKHEYFFQVQGQLMVTGAPFCDFVVYTKKDLVIVRVFPDTLFMEMMLSQLACFYQSHAIPYLNEQ